MFCLLFQTHIMSQVDTLTALIDFYGLKKEGKVSGNARDPCLTAGKVKIEGAMPILTHLDSKQNILGVSDLQRALVRQWVTFQVCDTSRKLLKRGKK